MSDVRTLGDRYELGETLGRGGMAEVLEGRDLRLGRRVAVKVLRPDLARDPAFQARFRREAQSAASLNHPNIVAVYDTGEDVLGDGSTRVIVPYIVMEYVDGQTLRQLLSSGRRLLPERALEITAGVLAALDYSHRHGIVHRDIKPANVMLTRTGEVKVMDFGIARALADASATMTAASAVMGTAQYLSPEQARGEVVDARSDLYSTGCLLYELLTGRPPFTGDSPVSVAYQHVSEAPIPPSQVDPAVPPALDGLVMRSLAKSADDRYQSAAEFRADVDRAIAGLPVTAAVPRMGAGIAGAGGAPTALVGAVGAPLSSIRAVEPPSSRRSPWMWIGLIVVIVVVAVGALVIGKFVFGASAAEKVTVPNLVGLSIPAARQQLQSQGLAMGQTNPVVSDKPKDEIIAQEPLGGQQLEKGQSVNITYSAGKAKVQVPDVVRMPSKSAAQTALSDADLALGEVSERDSEQPAGTVLAQDPAAGVTVDAGTKVAIAISNGLVTVPSVVGLSQAQASSNLSNAGFQLKVITQVSTTDPVGTVMAQAPTANSKAKKGSQVTITVAVAPSPTATASTGPPSTSPPAATGPSGSPSST